MKRFAAIILMLAVLLTASALAEENVYLRELPQDYYFATNVFSAESYPEVRLSAFTPYYFFRDSRPVDPVFLCFPLPDGALASSFSTHNVHALDLEKAVQYDYEVRESDSWEEFLNRASKEEYILCEGEDGFAAYINPKQKAGYAMIATRQFGKSSKLLIEVRLDYLGNNMTEDRVIPVVTEAVLAEAGRVYEQMRYETETPFWNADSYAGFKMLDRYDAEYMVRFTIPDMKLTFQEGSVHMGTVIVTEARTTRFVYRYAFGEGRSLEVEAEMTDNPFTVYQLEDEKSPDARKVTLADGREGIVYASGMTKNGESSYVYFSIPLHQKEKYGGMYHLVLLLNGRNIAWSDYDDLLEDLNRFAEGIEELETADDPYVPAEPVEPDEAAGDEPAEEEPAEDGVWICPGCGIVCSRQFCPECGAARPENSAWTCPECGSENDARFCPECGAPRP